MSVSTEVRRTLVKSPPELWAELSDPATLAKHLGELGEIRIVKTDPERTVDWEATAADGGQASGSIQIESSGWGTRVTISASRLAPGASESSEPGSTTNPEAAETEPAAAETKTEAEAPVEPEQTTDAEATGVQAEGPVESEDLVEPEAAATETEVPAKPEPQMTDAEITGLEPEGLAEPEPEVAPYPEPAPAAEPRKGFFARLFRRHKSAHGAAVPLMPEPAPELAPEPQPGPPPEPVASGPEPVAIASEEEPPAETVAASKTEPDKQTPRQDIAAELAALEEQTTAMLTGVLDRLGAAHHRPFSRA